MQADVNLIYSSHNWRKTLQSFQTIEDNNKKLALEPYPDEKVLTAFAKLAYSDCAGKLDLPIGWELLTTAQNNSWGNGYFGCAVWNPSEQQVAIAHRGTNPKKVGPLYADGKGVYFNKYTDHMFSAVTFADDIKEAILRINTQYESRFVLSLSGHSLGAWLAGVTTLTAKYLKRKGSGFCRIKNSGEGLHVHTVALDSPGVEDMLIKICNDYDVRYDRSMCTKQLDITTFFAAPNLVNSTGFHVGDLLQIYTNRVALPSDRKAPTLMLNMDTHSIDKFIEAFKDGKETYVVKNWPHGFSERKYYHGLEMFCNSYILQEDVGRVPPTSSSGGQQNTQPVDGNADSIYADDTPILQYSTFPSLGNTCHLGVFSPKELSFLQNWSLFQNNTLMKLTKIEKFANKQQLFKLNLPLFEIDTRRNTITCETREHLRQVIGQTKQLLRWFPAEITHAMAKQNKSIKSAPLHMAGQAYLRTLPDILDCEDTLNLEAFLESSEHRILQIESGDLKFEAARLYNIFKRIRNTTLDAIYFKENCQTFLCWKDLVGIAKDINIKDLNRNDVTNDNLLILEMASPADNSHPNYKILRNIFNNLETCSHKKLVIITSHPIDWQNLMDCKLSIINKPLKIFELNDLTSTSRDYILSRDAIALEEETLSLKSLLGNDCKSDDELVRNRINKLLSPMLKNLATHNKYIITIPYKLPRLCELDALYSKGNKRVEKAKILALLKRTETDGPLLVISDPEQLSQDYWGEVANAARGRIFTSEEDGQDLFLEKCREKSAGVIYWLHLGAEGLNMNELYNSGLYMPRKFHTRFIIKSVDAFVRYNGVKDIFIFKDVEDKLTLISFFKLSKKAKELFVSKDHFRIQIRSYELNTGIKNKEELLNKHYFKMLEIRGSPYLVWQYSHGSLDGLRSFITRDCSDPIEEGVFSNTEKKLTIIADDPGMGKTTSLTRISELIRGSWVLRIDHNHLSAIDKLPLKMNLQTVTKCLIHASGLPTDDDLLRSLLQHCLESDSSRQVYILLDAFDEIVKEKTKMEKLLTFLKNNTKCKTVVTTRVHPQEWLENELSEFAIELEKITEEEQDDYMMNSWLPHLALELPEHGESEKMSLLEFARELREEMEGVLGEDLSSFMGIPLQIRMLAEVFLQQAIQSVVSPGQAQSLSKITNLFDLYKQFIEVKKSIYFEQKNIFNKDPSPTIKNQLVKSMMKSHRLLAFQSIDPKFAAEYFPNTIISNQELKDISELGLLRANINGTFSFIHRTFEEYFCADFFVQWLGQRRRSKENETLVTNKLCVFLLRPDYYLIRKFIETQLDLSPTITRDALENNPMLYQHWSEHRQLFFHDHYKTPLHIAAEEQNWHIFAVLLSGPSSGTSEEVYISFIVARDKAGRTALNIVLESQNRNIVRQIMENVGKCSYESLLKLMLSTFLDMGGDRNESIFKEYCSDTQPSISADKALRRTEQIREQITPFTAAVRENDYGTVQKILVEMESDIERSQLLISIDSQGDTAINLAARKEDHQLFKLFAKQGVCMSFDVNWVNPLHCASIEGHISIVKYLLNQSNGTYDTIKTINNFNYLDEKVTTFHKTEIYKKFHSIQSKGGNTALQYAAYGGHYEIASVLLEIGADIHSRDNNRQTSLMVAAIEGHLEVVDLLLLNGANLNSRDVDGRSALLCAAGNGHLSTVNKLLENGADIYSRNNGGCTALMYAAYRGHLEVVQFLLLNGADVHTKDDGGRTALMYAAFNEHLQVIDLLLINGADLNSQQEDGISALIFAAVNDNIATVHKLLEMGADIHTRDDNGWTALMHAANKEHLEVVDLLLLNGADLNSQLADGNNALLFAANNGRFATVNKLLKKGADIHSKNNEGCTALMLAATNDHLDIIDLLVLNGADLNSQQIGGFSALLLAAVNGNIATVHKLLEKGADIHARDNYGWTALMHAASKEHLEIVDLLLLNGADLNYQLADGNTALLFAALNGRLAIVHKLLEKGADIHLKNNEGCTALMLAAMKGHLEVIDLLLLNGADLNSQLVDGNTALLFAAGNGDLATVHKLLEKGADIHLKNNEGCTALMLAAMKGHLEVIDLLLLNGADLNSQLADGNNALLYAAGKGLPATVHKLLEMGADIHSRNNGGCTALMVAAWYGHLDIVKLLLLSGAGLNSTDMNGDTAFLHAAAGGQAEMVLALLQNGVDVNSQRDDGRTALSLAAHKGHVNVVEVLLQHNADVSSQDKDGKTALSWAEEKEHREVVDLLRSHQEVIPIE